MNDLESKRHAAADVIAHPTSIAQTRQNASLPKFSPLSLPPASLLLQIEEIGETKVTKKAKR